MNGNENKIKGLFAILLGLMLIFFSNTITMRRIFFCGGIFLIYYGFKMLNIAAVNNFFANVKGYIQRFI